MILCNWTGFEQGGCRDYKNPNIIPGLERVKYSIDSHEDGGYYNVRVCAVMCGYWLTFEDLVKTSSPVYIM
jgi:hypothetical protein